VADALGTPDSAETRERLQSRARGAIGLAAFVGGFVFLLFVAGIGISRFVDRAENDYTPERLETARWDCVEAFVRGATNGGERLRLEIEPADDTYIRQRIIESVFPIVDLTASEAVPALRVAVRPGDDPDATCRGLQLSIERP